MILLVPIAPEVPKIYSERIWHGLVFIIILCLGYIQNHEIVRADSEFVENLYSVGADRTQDGDWVLRPESQQYLKLRPLMRTAPAPADWDVRRLILSNFIHGSVAHLAFNLVGIFAGARLLAVFVPFLCTISIFVLGGSLGILASLLLSDPVGRFVPHVGASGGIFALMGAYYVYNFRFRTRYFFWFPTRAGNIALRTSWFFFLDVLLLELVLSAVQLFPGRMDNVDHLAHVFGFSAGMGLALMIRTVQRWPGFLQTRGEYLLWGQKLRKKGEAPLQHPLEQWIELLHINPYNDQLKIRLLRNLYHQVPLITKAQITSVFSFVTPTFIRLHSEESAAFVREVLANSGMLPKEWLSTTPYDSIIRLAKHLSNPPEEQHLLVKLVTEYQRAQPGDKDIERKLELLMKKLSQVVPASATVGGTRGTSTSSTNPPPRVSRRTGRTAKTED